MKSAKETEGSLEEKDDKETSERKTVIKERMREMRLLLNEELNTHIHTHTWIKKYDCLHTSIFVFI